MRDPITATLKSWKQVEQATTRDPAITYRHPVRASFSVLNHGDNKSSTFELVIPREVPGRVRLWRLCISRTGGSK